MIMIARVDFFLFAFLLFKFCLFFAFGNVCDVLQRYGFSLPQRSQTKQWSCISFKISLNQFQTYCQIFTFPFGGIVRLAIYLGMK